MMIFYSPMKFIVYLLTILFCFGCKTTSAPVVSQSIIKTIGVNVKDFGAKGDGVHDDTAAFEKALIFMKKSTPWQSTRTNGTTRGIGKLLIPKGLYSITRTISIKYANGLTIEGEGREASVLVFKPKKGKLFDIHQAINVVFRDFGIDNGRIDNGKMKNRKYVDRSKSTKAIGFYWNGKNGDRFLRYENIFARGFDYVWYIDNKFGDQNHSDVMYTNCIVTKSNNVLFFNNTQAVNHSFYDCSFERIRKSVFHIKRGGYINIYGGSFISDCDFLTFENDSDGLGRLNNHFYIQNSKFEMYENFDRGATPKIVNCIKPVTAKIIFNNVSNGAASKNNKTYFKLKGNVKLKFIDSDISGNIDNTQNKKDIIFVDTEFKGKVLGK